MERYIIVERYADNGELSHRALVDSTDGRELGADGGEPEDQSFWRDWAWVPDELNKAQATVEALWRERDQWKEAFERSCDDTAHLKAARDAEREKRENLEHQIAARGGLAEIDDSRAKAGLYDVAQTQLSQLQALVRALVCTMGYVVDGSYILTRGGVVLYACSSSISAERLGALLAYRATLDATATERRKG